MYYEERYSLVMRNVSDFGYTAAAVSAASVRSPAARSRASRPRTFPSHARCFGVHFRWLMAAKRLEPSVKRVWFPLGHMGDAFRFSGSEIRVSGSEIRVLGFGVSGFRSSGFSG